MTCFFSPTPRGSLRAHVRSHVRLGARSPLLPLFVLFLLVQVFFQHHGGTNAASRLAHLASLVDRGSSRIDPYVEVWTTDWARTPEGAYYSNKAPGPVFLALPLYYVFDRITTRPVDGDSLTAERRAAMAAPFLRTASILLQVLPFLALGLYFLGRLIRCGVAFRVQVWWTLAYLFGTTASVFMNTFFGHGVALVFVLAMVLLMLEGAWWGVGFCFGWGVLSDYAAGMLLPPLLLFLIVRRSSAAEWRRFLAGGVVPGLVWVVYHTASFGTPWTLPQTFQNPIYVDAAGGPTSLWGVLHPLLATTTVSRLVWGLERGLLWTQPWVLIVLGAVAVLIVREWRTASARGAVGRWALFVGLSFAGVFLMNASFGGWHGGASSGPRYLIIVLPLVSFFLPYVLTGAALPAQGLAGRLLPDALMAAVAWSVLVCGIVLSTTILAAPDEPLYVSVGRHLWTPRSPTAPLRFLAFLLALGVCGVLVCRRARAARC